MRLRRLWLATQFLTRLPAPAVPEYSSTELSRSAAWFPLVGAAVGALVTLAVLPLADTRPLLAAACGVLVWAWSTGALHLDGLGDLADALAASHRDPQRFFAVLRDPHAGAFAVVAIVVVLLLKLAALGEVAAALVARPSSWLALPLIAAWARLGPLAWSRWLQPLQSGQGERFGWELTTQPIVSWTVGLLVASALVAPVLCVAPLLLLAWGQWLQKRLGGYTGDCLGAGVECIEAALLLSLAMAGA